jgi:glycosyltransferase involved in cell wall biosynthesis
MKKILIVTSGFPLWEDEGLNMFMLEFAQTLAKDFEVHVLAPFSKRSKRFEKMGDISVYRHNQFPFINAELAYGSGIVGNIKKNPLLLFPVPFFFLLQLLAIRKIVKKHNIDIINAHWIIPQGVTAVLYKKLFNRKIKILSAVHGSDYNALNNFIGNFLKRFALNNSSATTVVSRALYDALSMKGFKNLTLSPMGIDTDRFSPEKKSDALKTRLGAEGGFLLYVGGLIEGKGVRYLVSAMPNIVEKFPKVKLVMIGEGYMEKELKALARTLGIENNILFAGVVPNANLPEYFATADVFILPSFSEGFPIVIKEAMSCGTLSIVTDLPVFSSHPLLNEVLFKVRIANTEDISVRVTDILKNQESLFASKLKSREFILKTADWEIIRNNYRQTIESL